MSEQQSDPQNANPQTLLTCTVGGSPQPIITAIEKIQPGRVIFICSAESEPILSGPQPQLKNSQRGPASTTTPASATAPAPQWLEAPIRSSEAKNVVVTDAQKIGECVKSIWESVHHEIRDWQARSDKHQIMVDITGGTKAMSAALALCARSWDCRFYYTGGKQRDKAGLGVVQDGSEQAFQTENPWDSLGYQVIEDFKLLFNGGHFAAARIAAENFQKQASEQNLKKTMTALMTLAAAYQQWEAFNHQGAKQKLDDATDKYRNELHSCGPQFSSREFQNKLQTNLGHLEKLAGAAGQPSAELVFDLLANARRRGAEGRFDDAVARLYRCTEAAAQYQLASKYKIQSGAAKLNELPDSLQQKWQIRADANGEIKLALQDDYELLGMLGDDLGKRFTELGLDGEKSPLSGRNKSILAHGFEPIQEQAYNAVLKKVQELIRVIGNEGIAEIGFPRIGE